MAATYDLCPVAAGMPPVLNAAVVVVGVVGVVGVVAAVVLDS